MGEIRYVSPNGSSFSLTPFSRSFSYRTLSGNQSLGLNTLISRHPFSLGYQFDFPVSGNNAYACDHVFFVSYQLNSKPVKKNNKTN